VVRLARPRTPSAVLELRGAYKINPGRKRLEEPEFENTDVACPDYLSDRAKAEWARVYPLLRQAGVMTAAFMGALAAYCHYYSQWAEAVGNIKGLLVKFEQDGEPVKSTYIDIARDASKECRAWAIELGLTAVSKTRASSTATKKKENRFDKFTPAVRPN
jgi:P27 family predicted phage terminase small subunit